MISFWFHICVYNVLYNVVVFYRVLIAWPTSINWPRTSLLKKVEEILLISMKMKSQVSNSEEFTSLDLTNGSYPSSLW